MYVSPHAYCLGHIMYREYNETAVVYWHPWWQMLPARRDCGNSSHSLPS